jgi:hypothetical protein
LYSFAGISPALDKSPQPDYVRAAMQQRNYPKICGLIGAALGFIYMIFTVLAPSSSGEVVPWTHQAWRIVVLAPFFAVFGALVGTGIGFLVAAVLRKR